MDALRTMLALPGYWLVTALAFVWGAVLSRFRVRRHGALIVCNDLPRWAYARGGTTFGAVYLTGTNDSDSVLEHELVHRDQWRRYGLAFLVLYPAAGRSALSNRFEIEAGLEKAGYR